MSGADDRRAPGASRAPFEGLVEVGGTLGPSFEAEAVNVSEEGMKLRTAYLPELGQQVTCRFEAGAGQTIIASGDVVWSRGGDACGEFGIRFTDIDPDSVEPLKRVCGAAAPTAPGQPGAKVRLYIDGLASPMRAKVRDSHPGAITVGSDLGFLQVGKHIELEDAQSGRKRPASIDRVDVAVDPSSQVPQLVVTLRYNDAPSETGHDPQNRSSSTPTYPSGDPASLDDAPARMRSALSRQAARIGPALNRVAQRAKVAAMLLIARGRDDTMPRRTTAPPPGGGLHSLGRRVVRGDAGTSTSEDTGTTQLKQVTTKRKAILGAGALAVAVVGAVVLKQAHFDSPQPPATTAGAPVEAASASNAPASVAANASATNASTVAAPAVTQAATSSSMAATDENDDSHAASHKKQPRPTPFANGPVHHGNVLRLKMDGPVETIEGAQQPTGFTVKIPGRKSLEAAAPLAARDSRIAAIKVANESSGAELNVTFKDGVPNYHVSAHGDVLVIALAPPGALETTTAKRDDKGSKTPKRGTRERDTAPER